MFSPDDGLFFASPSFTVLFGLSVDDFESLFGLSVDDFESLFGGGPGGFAAELSLDGSK